MRNSLIAILLFLLSGASPAGAASPTLVIKRLTLDAATRVAQQALQSCRDKGLQVGVTVVDRDGITQVTLRDSLAPPITLAISEGKAKAAAYFGVSTEALKERANTPIGRLPGVVMATGGLPIEAGGSLFGAVGVSGAPSGQTDEECAKAGVNAVLEELELGM